MSREIRHARSLSLSSSRGNGHYPPIPFRNGALHRFGRFFRLFAQEMERRCRGADDRVPQRSIPLRLGADTVFLPEVLDANRWSAHRLAASGGSRITGCETPRHRDSLSKITLCASVAMCLSVPRRPCRLSRPARRCPRTSAPCGENTARRPRAPSTRRRTTRRRSRPAPHASRRSPSGTLQPRPPWG